MSQALRQSVRLDVDASDFHPRIRGFEQAGESVKDAPILRAARESLTDSPVCSTTVVEGEAVDHARANSAGVRYAKLLCGRCWL